MSYKNSFSGQWDSLKVAFKAEMSKLPADAITLKKLGDWYRAYSFRWSSIVETEGLLLGEQKNEQFRRELLNGISDFKFQEIKGIKKPSFVVKLLIAIAVAIVIGLVLHFALKAKVWIIIVQAVVCLLASLVSYASSLDKYEKNSVNHLVEGYAKQLEEYKNTLIVICDKYGE